MENVETKQSAVAERVIVGFIVAAASVCVGLITVYLCMFDGSGLLH
jgi:hypothetical protein